MIRKFDHRSIKRPPLQPPSVIIPTFNRAHILAKSIDSVLLQKRDCGELIIVDDGSTDETAELVKSYQEIHGAYIKYIFHDNCGVATSRNRGIELAKSQWVAFLDSDDQWLKNKIKSQLSFLDEHEDIHFVHTNEKWQKNGEHLNQKDIHTKGGGDQFTPSLERCMISPSTVLTHKNLLNVLGLFDEDFLVCEDYELWLHITANLPVGYIKKVKTIKTGGHSDQLSQKYRAMDVWRFLALVQLAVSNTAPEEKSTLLAEAIDAKHSLLVKVMNKHNRHELAKFCEDLMIQYLLYKRDSTKAINLDLLSESLKELMADMAF